MTDAGTVRVEGARQLRAGLKKASNGLIDMKPAHARAAEIAAERSAELAPERSGRLKRTIRGAGTKTAAIIRSGNNTTVRYAGPIQWGWFKRHIKPNLFLTRGSQDSERRWLPVYEDYVHAAIDYIEGI